eukprot:2736423-Rhodomonas_salina.2
MRLQRCRTWVPAVFIEIFNLSTWSFQQERLESSFFALKLLLGRLFPYRKDERKTMGSNSSWASRKAGMLMSVFPIGHTRDLVVA